MSERTIFQAMSRRHVLSLGPAATVHEAASVMTRANCGSVLIIDQGSQLLGIVTERDLMTRVLVQGLDPAATPLRRVATIAPITIAEGASVRQCAYLIRDKGFRHVPVVSDDGKVVGMISTRDFLAELASGFERVIQRVCATSDAVECEDYYQYVVGDFVD